MYIIDVLCEDELKKVKKLFDDLNYVLGETNQGLNKSVKYCKTVDLNHQSYVNFYNYLHSIFSKKTIFNTKFSFKDITIPYPVRYSEGMFYDYHIDELEIGNLRTDYSMTLFLSDPEEYEGGELILNQGDFKTPVKLSAGKAIIYDTGIVHKVNTVTSGNRDVILFWAQSLIKDKFIREHCVELATISSDFSSDQNLTNNCAKLEQCRINLLRKYGDI